MYFSEVYMEVYETFFSSRTVKAIPLSQIYLTENLISLSVHCYGRISVLACVICLSVGDGCCACWAEAQRCNSIIGWMESVF